MYKLLPILTSWRQGSAPIAAELAHLWAMEQVAAGHAHAFGLSENNGLAQIALRSQLFQALAPDIIERVKYLGYHDEQAILVTLWRFWLPFCLQMAEIRKNLDRPLIQGILGGQGTGKTTLTQVCAFILEFLGYSSFGLSLDDLYKTYADRQEMLKTYPRLRWRGPPGTHDIGLGISVLEQVHGQANQGDRPKPILFPQFDKSLQQGAGDRTAPKSVESVDIVFFEGWFVGVRPVNPAIFNQRLEPIVTEADQQFARDSNQRLREYLPLWALLDRLLILYPIDYRFSKQWRMDAERQMKAQGKAGMSDGEIDLFVEYFWKALHPEVFIAPLTQIPQFADGVVEIKADHSVGKIYRPGYRLV